MRHSGTGLLAVTSLEIGHLFLDRFGDRSPNPIPLMPWGRKSSIQASPKPLRQDIVVKLQTPYIPYSQALAREQEKKELEWTVKILIHEFAKYTLYPNL